MTNPRDADDFSTAPIDASEDEDLGEDDPKADHEPTTVTVSGGVIQDIIVTVAKPKEDV